MPESLIQDRSSPGQEIDCYGLVIVLIATSLNEFLHFLRATSDQVSLPALECHTTISQHMSSPVVTRRPGGSALRPLTIMIMIILMTVIKKYEI